MFPSTAAPLQGRLRRWWPSPMAAARALRWCHPPAGSGRAPTSTQTLTPIKKVLVANRGEIACRVMRTASRMGIQTVAVYSDADADAMHVSMADEAYNIGPAPVQDSYLQMERIVEVARRAHCQAVHPGYGFLSENMEFAHLCQRAGIIFVGPPAAAIRDMGIKSTSKAIMAAAGVPVIDGYHGDDHSTQRLREEAQRIGFPVMIKAVRGGGGKGMRIALTADEFDAQLESARTESSKAFGDGAVLLERFVHEPRHIEVQVFGDRYGNYVHLFERDCSVQRRHQKVVEEAPAPGLSASLRADLGRAAVRAACAVKYVGAGTVEFILDCRSDTFHFMEMNTRLQVEHPVTEMVTGTDLVQWQLEVAAGKPLPLCQDDIALSGHAFEARIYAESPDRNFLPGAGPLLHLAMPEPAQDVRVDTGMRRGDEVSVYYDPMIAKLVVWGEDRHAALRKLRARLTEFNVVGVDTNVDFLMALSDNADFAAGAVHTGFIEQHRLQLFPPRTACHEDIVQAVMAVVLNEQRVSAQAAAQTSDPFGPFATGAVGIRVNHQLVRTLVLQHHSNDVTVQVTYRGNGGYTLKVDHDDGEVDVSGLLVAMPDGGSRLTCIVDGGVRGCRAIVDGADIHLFTKDGSRHFSLPEPAFMGWRDQAATNANASAGDLVVVPMPGIVDKVLVSAGQSVSAGEPLLVVIAMKMEHVIRAPRDATIGEVLCRCGDSVAKSATVVTFTH